MCLIFAQEVGKSALCKFCKFVSCQPWRIVAAERGTHLQAWKWAYSSVNKQTRPAVCLSRDGSLKRNTTKSGAHVVFCTNTNMAALQLPAPHWTFRTQTFKWLFAVSFMLVQTQLMSVLTMLQLTEVVGEPRSLCVGHECCEMLWGAGRWSRGQTVFWTPAEGCTGSWRHWTAGREEKPFTEGAAASKRGPEWSVWMIFIFFLRQIWSTELSCCCDVSQLKVQCVRFQVDCWVVWFPGSVNDATLCLLLNNNKVWKLVLILVGNNAFHGILHMLWS